MRSKCNSYNELEALSTNRIGQISHDRVHQDDFVLDQLGLTAGSSRIVATAIVAHKKSMRRSRTTWRQYLEAMALPGVGLQKSYAEVSSPEFKKLLRDVIRTGDWLPD